MSTIPRVAFFPDSYLEVNGAAMTCKRLVNFAKSKDRPFLCVHAGPETRSWDAGSIRNISLKRSPLAIPLDEGLAYDPLFQRFSRRVEREIVSFKPDVLHITGINDISTIASFIAWKHQIPMVGSWHTNVHEFAASRLSRIMRFLPKGINDSISGFAEKKIMQGCILYYKQPKVVLSPNDELVSELGRRTQRSSRLMARGVDSEFFSPEKRKRKDDVLTIGYVGRLRAEKNVKLLVDIEKGLTEAGVENFKFLVVGDGSEAHYLEENMHRAEFTGFLDGEELATAYANMDIFVFPSETDAFGNVAQEANASGVPAIVTDKGGPKYIIKDGETGYIASGGDDFVAKTVRLAQDPETLARMKSNARKSALSRSWESIFEGVYDAYREAICIAEEQKAEEQRTPVTLQRTKA